MTEPKPVKAWAVVDGGDKIDADAVYAVKGLAEAAASSPFRVIPVTIVPGHEAELPADVVRLVIAARQVAFGDPLPESIKELDAASEAFADRVGWEYDPNEAEDD